MEFTIGLDKLQKALKVVGAVAKPNSPEAAGQVLLDIAEDGSIVFVGNNGRLATTHMVTGNVVKTQGTVCVPFTKLASFANSFIFWDGTSGVKDVTFKNLKKNVSVRLTNTFETGKTSKNKLLLKTFPQQKFFVPEPFKKEAFRLRSVVLKLAIAKVLYAIDPNAQQSFIQGMNISFTQDNIYFVATDALKLSEYSTKNTGNLFEGSYIVPHSFIIALRKIAASIDDISFDISDGKIKALVNNSVLHSNLIVDAAFPDYQSTFDNYKHKIVIDKEVMLSCFIPYLGVLNDDDNKRLTIELKNKQLCMSSPYFEAEYESPIDFDGEFIIDINGLFLAQTLDAIQDDILDMYFSDKDGYLIFDSSNFKDQKALITNIKRA